MFAASLPTASLRGTVCFDKGRVEVRAQFVAKSLWALVVRSGLQCKVRCFVVSVGQCGSDKHLGG